MEEKDACRLRAMEEPEVRKEERSREGWRDRGSLEGSRKEPGRS
jgi:hypothetical protein